ncbi:hypothetical protein [Neorhodopirellula lusitana]|uniref:hypothetical protein n=1 Tax=Neorhodopirellula lusitana TaxID=445327 RepID=UPI0024B64BBB|nr:hypothetical protein [Neorhodopirellula lusitana]
MPERQIVYEEAFESDSLGMGIAAGEGVWAWEFSGEGVFSGDRNVVGAWIYLSTVFERPCQPEENTPQTRLHAITTKNEAALNCDKTDNDTTEYRIPRHALAFTADPCKEAVDLPLRLANRCCRNARFGLQRRAAF